MDEGQIKTNIQKKRISLGYTQTEMARRLDISLNAYRKLENGKTKIFSDSFKRFAEDTGSTITELAEGFDGNSLVEEIKKIHEDCDKKILELQKEHAEETQKLQSQLNASKETIRDKEEIINSCKKLITQYEKRIEELEKKLSE